MMPGSKGTFAPSYVPVCHRLFLFSLIILIIIYSERRVSVRADMIAEYVSGLIPASAVFTVGKSLRRRILNDISSAFLIRIESGISVRADMVTEDIACRIPVAAVLTVSHLLVLCGAS